MKELSFCPEGERRLTSYLEGRLRAGERAAFEEHADACELCRDQVELWKHLSELPAPRPSAAFATNFEAMLQRESHRPMMVKHDSRMWAGWAVAACLLMSLGFLSGNFFASRDAKAEIAETRKEVQSMRTLVAVSMLQQQSAIERLRGVNYSVGIEGANDEVVTALIETLRGDSSVDVRLAAADALNKYAVRPKVRAALADALLYQDSPLLQINLIDTLTGFKEQRAVRAFETLAKTPETDSTVKQRLQQAIEEMGGAKKVQ